MNSHAQIAAALERYFDGIFYGDVEKLQTVFHPAATLFSEVNGVVAVRPWAEYLEVVRSRKSPSENGEARGMEIISIEVQGPIAFAKVQCRMLGFHYRDFLSLQFVEDNWRIVCKLFTHVRPEQR
ncbi:nuclear transport factor 2 family protein [Pseudoduganella sp. UC29_106]|uniref:nuclear transport factor 2 family protein n=1 Tax=Pseudoduganella sp. UC29_106 TaxID=3374553 RepID=UPI0037578A87